MLDWCRQNNLHSLISCNFFDPNFLHVLGAEEGAEWSGEGRRGRFPKREGATGEREMCASGIPS